MATQPGSRAGARFSLASAMLRAWRQTAQLRSPSDDRGPQLWPGAASLYGFTYGHLIDMLRERIVLLGVVVTTIASVAELDRLGLTGYALPHALDTQSGLPCPHTGPNLNNYGMPFLRYSIEDVGAWRVQSICPCGRDLPMMDLVQGRRVDMFHTRDGRAVWGGFASPLFGMPGIKQFQLVQKSFDLVLARLVKDQNLDQARLVEIERCVKAALGDHVVTKFEFPDEIAVYESGKYRYVLSALEESQRDGSLDASAHGGARS